MIWKKRKIRKSPSKPSTQEKVPEHTEVHAEAPETPAQRREFKKHVVLAGVLTLVVASGIILVMTLIKSHGIRSEREARQRDADQGQLVQLAKVEKAPPFRNITLIGEARPFFDVIIYARAAGYLTHVNVDKGDHVKEGQVLAMIESPETDKAYISALADWYNKKRIAARSKILLKRKLISQQEADAAFATADMAAATLETQRVLKSYEQVRAPFSGTIANRYVDPGALLQNSTSNVAQGGALFEIAQNDYLRIYSYPDQPDAAFVKPGTAVEITLTEKPKMKLEGKVTRTSELLDSKTRKLLTEVDISNNDGSGDANQVIVAGSFVQVHLRLDEGEHLQVPVEALALRDDKPMIPVVSNDQSVHYTTVTLGKNDGQNLQILSGLKEGELVALNIGNSINEGQKIHGQLQSKQAAMAGHASLTEQGAVPQIGVDKSPAPSASRQAPPPPWIFPVSPDQK